MKRPAVFLDRDGTIIEDRGYVRRPDDVALLAGAVEGIGRLTRAGFATVLVSNQSGVARGLFTEEDLAAVHARLQELLAERGVALDASYYCPYFDGPDATVEAYRRDSDLRKPRPGMLLQAARELDLDLSRSWMIGNSASDVEAGRRAGCRSVLIDADRSPSDNDAEPGVWRARDLGTAADIVERNMQRVEEAPQNTADKSKATNETDSSRALGRIGAVLERIDNRVEQLARDERQHDFSLVRLFAALLQMFAIAVGLWGLIAHFDHLHDAAAARFAFACFLQLAALTSFVVDRFR
jgi:D-glycero-D-manno-heptose 1,7-bisphosphate phosphatase